MLNNNYGNLKENYLFSTIAQKVSDYTKANPDAPIIKLGIGDVTKPLSPSVITALQAAVVEMGQAETFRGYGPEQGYDFLREAIAGYINDIGGPITAADVFVGDGAKSGIANILDIFSTDCKVLIPDPVYPVYLDTNIMDGRDVIFVNATKDNDFSPLPEAGVQADLIYICSPNNPTGATYTKEQLQAWVDYANAQEAIILFDNAYEAFISDPALPRTIFSIPGAETCAIEISSFSKTAGFTGLRCSYTIISEKLVRDGRVVRDMWLRRQTSKYNGVPYIVQRAAEAVFSEEGRAEFRANIDYYRENARMMTEAFDEMGIYYTGGHHSPYIWLKCPKGMSSWECFDLLLEEANVVGTPGSGFGTNGEGFFRLTAFNTHEKTREAIARIKKVLA